MKDNRAVLYLRLSKEDIDKVNAGDESASIQNQQLLLTDFALSCGFLIVGIYKDDNFSGLFDTRPDFQRLIEDAEESKFDIVISKSQSRFTRNMEHLEKYLHKEFVEWGIRFIGVVDHIDTEQKGNKKARQINGLINEWYCEDLSENIRETFKAKMRQGQFLGSSCPYGYRKDPDDHHHLVIDEYAAGVVRRIFTMYLSGIGKRKIGTILTTEGILIPSRYKREVLNEGYRNANERTDTKVWSFQTIHQILQNETYIGNLVQNRCSSPSYKTRKKKKLPREEWIRVEGTHEPIISKELFDRTQELGKVRTRTLANTERVGLFSGLLFCADCQGAMGRCYNRNSEFVGYICRKYKMYGKQYCTSHKITEPDLKSAVLEALRVEARKALSPEDVEELRQMKLSEQKQKDYGTVLRRLELKREDIKELRMKAYMDYAGKEKILDFREYCVLKEKFEEEEQELEKQIVLYKKKLVGEDGQKERYEEWVERFSNYIEIDELSREVMVEMIDRIEVEDKNGINIYFKFINPYEKS